MTLVTVNTKKKRGQARDGGWVRTKRDFNLK
jgi:hypothetical protein